jgi:hypothetical protein
MPPDQNSLRIGCPEAHEKMAVFRRCSIYQGLQATIRRKIQCVKLSPFISSYAENQILGESTPPKVDAINLALLSAGKDENTIRSLRRLSDIEETEDSASQQNSPPGFKAPGIN